MATTSLSAGDSNDFASASQYAFILQYISLMIIILAMIVGFYGSTVMQNEKSGPLEKAPEATVEEQILGTFTPSERLQSKFEYNDLFDSRGNLNLERADSIVSFLMNHDLQAIFEINSGICAEQLNEFCLAKEMERAEILSDYLYLRNLPKNSFEILHSDRLEAGITTIRLYKEERAL